MSVSLTLLVLAALTVVGFYFGRARSKAAVTSIGQLHSLPSYYGYYVAVWCGVPSFLFLCLWLVVQPHVVESAVISQLPAAQQKLPPERLNLILNDIRNLARGDATSGAADPAIKAAAAAYNRLNNIGNLAVGVIAICLALAGATLAMRRMTPSLRARNIVERVLMIFLMLASTIAILTTVGIVLSVLFESFQFFQKVSVFEFLFGLEWSPQIAIRQDQVGQSGAFGAVPIFSGTILITVIAMLIAVPVGLYAAIYLSEFANRRVRSTVKPVLEILAGIPTVVYGFFAALTVAPAVRQAAEFVGINASAQSALAAGVVMGIMIIPFVSSLSDDVINAVPQSLRDGAYGLGATKAETVKNVILPAALPGIVGAVLLAVSRAIGETMIVVMAAGQSANLTANPFEAVTTVTVQIVTLLVGDQEFDSPKTLAAFALGLLLFVVTLVLNVIALHVVRKYREQYE